MIASAAFQISSDGGSSYAAVGTALADANALAYVSSGNYSIKARLDSTAGVGIVAWSIASADDAHVASPPTLTANTDKTVEFVVPKSGGAWLLKCLVNNDETISSTLAIKVLNSVGQQEIAVGETTQAGTYGYTKAWNDVARAATATVGGLTTKSVTAGGTLVVSTGEAAYNTIELTGAAASNVLLQFPTTPGGRWTVRNLQTDRTKYVLLDDGGSGILLPPGASRVVGVGTDGVLFAADGKGLGFEFQLQITDGDVGDNITTLLAIPNNYLITEVYSIATAAPTDGASVTEEKIGIDDPDDVFLLGTIDARGFDTATDYGGAWTFGVIRIPTDVVMSHTTKVSVASAAGLALTVTVTGKRAVV
jgi:hypothetical protein